MMVPGVRSARRVGNTIPAVVVLVLAALVLALPSELASAQEPSYPQPGEQGADTGGESTCRDPYAPPESQAWADEVGLELDCDAFADLGPITLHGPDGEELPFNSSGGPSNLMDIDVPLRLLVATGLHAASAGGGRLLSLVDVDTLEQTGSIEVDPSLGPPTRLTIDEVQHRVFLAAGTQIATFSLTAEFDPTLIDIERGVGQLLHDPTRDVLYVVTPASLAVPYAGPVRILAFDAARLTEDPNEALLWSYDVNSCQGAKGASIGSTGDFLALYCGGYAVNPIFGWYHADYLGSPSSMQRLDLVRGSGPDDTSQFVTQIKTCACSSNAAFQGGDVLADREDNLTVLGYAKQFFSVEHMAWTGKLLPDTWGSSLAENAQTQLSGGTPPPTESQNAGSVAIDPGAGRAYVSLNHRSSPTADERFVAAQYYLTLSVTDSQGLPVPQGKRYVVALGDGIQSSRRGAVDPITRRIFLPVAGNWNYVWRDEGGGSPWVTVPAHLRVFEDRTPPLERPTRSDPDRATHDIDEIPGVTPVTFSGNASGYGSRVIEVQPVLGGGPDILAKTVDGGGSTAPVVRDRDVISAVVERTELTANAATATALGTVDRGVDNEVSGLVPAEAEDGLAASCSDFGDAPGTNSALLSEVSCDLEDLRVTATSAAAGTQHDGGVPGLLQVGSSSVTTEVFRDPERGMVARSEAVASGVSIGGVIHIGEVRALAESVAHGRPGTAATTYRAVIKQGRITDPAGETLFQCDECDPAEFSTAINRLFTTRFEASTGQRRTDPWSVGSPGGAQAVIAEDPYKYWNDFFQDHDARNEVYALNVIVKEDKGTESRHVYQFAAVAADAHYAIGLAAEPGPPPVAQPTRLTVELVDPAARPLTGGRFEVHRDADGDGALGLADPIVADGTCVTGGDGIGTCRFHDLVAGDYVVRQVAAPTGYATAPDLAVALAPGSGSTATFVNRPNVATIEISLTDSADPPAPLAGGVFELVSGGGIADTGPTDALVGSCTTDATGRCEAFADVSLGSYVVRQVAAPEGYAPSEPVGFELTLPGQLARVGFVNAAPVNQRAAGLTQGGPPTASPPSADPAPPGTADTSAQSGPEVSAPAPPSRTSMTPATGAPPAVDIRAPAPPAAPTVTAQPIALVLPDDAGRYVLRGASETVVFALAWLLLATPLFLSGRRRVLGHARQGA